MWDSCWYIRLQLLEAVQQACQPKVHFSGYLGSYKEAHPSSLVIWCVWAECHCYTMRRSIIIPKSMINPFYLMKNVLSLVNLSWLLLEQEQCKGRKEKNLFTNSSCLLALENVDILKWVQQSPKSSLFCLRIPKDTGLKAWLRNWLLKLQFSHGWATTPVLPGQEERSQGLLSFHTGGWSDCWPEPLTECYTGTFPLPGKNLVWFGSE